MPMMSEYRSRVAESFIRVLESGELNWRKPWNTGVTTAPYNPATNKRYNGINWIYLKATELNEGYRDNRWATFKQITDNGWHLKKGSRGTKVEYWMPLLPGKPGERGTVISWEKYRALSENQKAQAKFVPKYHTVFNGRDIEGLSEISIRANDNAVDADVLVWKISEAMQVSIFNDGGDTSFYSMSEDAIHLPEPKFFDDSYAYNATALHELAHATGAEERLNRDMVGSFGDKSYAYEELVAEITSCFMGEHIALPEAVKEEHLENHEAYVQGWVKQIVSEIRESSNVLFEAVKDAEKASGYLEEAAGLTKEKLAEKAFAVERNRISWDFADKYAKFGVVMTSKFDLTAIDIDGNFVKWIDREGKILSNTGDLNIWLSAREGIDRQLVSSSAKDAVEMVEDIKEIYDIPQDTDIGRFIDREDFAELYKAGEYLKELNWTADKCELNDSSLPGAGEEIKSSDMDIKDKERGEEL